MHRIDIFSFDFSCRYFTDAGLKKLVEKPGIVAENKNNVLDEQSIIKLALDVSVIYSVYLLISLCLILYLIVSNIRRIFVRLLVVL